MRKVFQSLLARKYYTVHCILGDYNFIQNVENVDLSDLIYLKQHTKIITYTPPPPVHTPFSANWVEKHFTQNFVSDWKISKMCSNVTWNFGRLCVQRACLLVHDDYRNSVQIFKLKI